MFLQGVVCLHEFVHVYLNRRADNCSCKSNDAQTRPHHKSNLNSGQCLFAEPDAGQMLKHGFNVYDVNK
jgi:hypothetical protein